METLDELKSSSRLVPATGNPSHQLEEGALFVLCQLFGIPETAEQLSHAVSLFQSYLRTLNDVADEEFRLIERIQAKIREGLDLHIALREDAEQLLEVMRARLRFVEPEIMTSRSYFPRREVLTPMHLFVLSFQRASRPSSESRMARLASMTKFIATRVL